MEKDIGSFDEHGDVPIEDVAPLSIAFLHTCIDAYVAGFPDHS